MVKRPITQLDLAQRLGVTQMTVSHAISGKGRMTSETRERVLALASELGYRPNGMARRVQEGRYRGLALLGSATRPAFNIWDQDFHISSSLDQTMTWTYGKKPRLNAASARNADGTWSIGLSNYTARDFSEQGDSGKWEIDQEGRPATTCAVTVQIDELAKAGDLQMNVWRSTQAGMEVAPTAVTMHEGRFTIDVAPFELVTLRSRP